METTYYLTGAAGYLGNWIARELIAQGKIVRGLVLPGDPLVAHLPESLERFEGNLLNPDDIERFLEAGEQRERVVIHCAGMISMSLQFDQRVYDINVTGTRNMLAVCERLRVKKFVYISSVHALPVKPKGQTIYESKVFLPLAMIGAYAQTKAEASNLVFAAAARGLPACMIHPSGICGPGDFVGGHLTQMFIEYSKGQIIAGVEGGYSYSDVRDVAKAAVSAVDNGEVGEGYIVASHFVTVREIFRLLREEVGGREVKLMLPVWAVGFLLPVLSLSYKMRRKKAVFSRYAIYTLNSNGDFSNRKARLALGFEPRPFQETVHDTILWLRHEGRI